MTARTVHFYVQQGLLPPAGAPGPGARYTQGHVSRLKLIRLLQKQHLPLAEIAKRLKGLTAGQVDDLLHEARARRASERGSALDYIRGVLNEPSALSTSSFGGSRLSALASRPERGKVAGDAQRPRAQSPRAQSPEPGPQGPLDGRSQWDRLTLTDGIELHVRRPLAREQQRQLDKIMLAARNIFGPEEEE